MSLTRKLKLKPNNTHLDLGGLNSFNTPFVESKCYADFKFDSNSQNYKKYCDLLNRDGFCVLDLDVPEMLLDQINDDIQNAVFSRKIINL